MGLPFMRPVVPSGAKSGRGCQKLLEAAVSLGGVRNEWILDEKEAFRM